MKLEIVNDPIIGVTVQPMLTATPMRSSVVKTLRVDASK
jgi:hypothetical protein